MTIKNLREKVVHKMNISRILAKQDPETVMVVKGQRYGFIGACRVKSVYSIYTREFRQSYPVRVSRDSTNALVITVN